MSANIPPLPETVVDAYIGLGSNQSRPTEQLTRAINTLRQHPAISLQAVSRFYRTVPMGEMDQPDYTNAVALVRTPLPPNDLLTELQLIETAQGRVRDGTKWSSRTLDLDLLLYGFQTIRSNRLTIPHSGLHERNFVVFPLLELCPNCQIPGLGSLQDISETLTLEGMIPL